MAGNNMSIEINGHNGRPPIDLGENRKPAGDSGKAATENTSSASASSNDKLSLTSSAQQLRALEEQVAELPVVDTQRVQEVQRAIATGSFQIDPAKVADKLLQFEAAVGAPQ